MRRRCLTSCTFSVSQPGLSCSTASPNSTGAPTGTSSSGEPSPYSQDGTRHDPGCQKTGGNGITPEGTGGGDTETGGDNTGRNSKEEAREKDAQVIGAELAFTIPLLLEAPKCYWIWNHRRWTLQQATLRLPTGSARAVWEQELGLASKMLAKDQRNFHAWSYRRWVVAQLEGPDLGGGSMVESEFKYTTDKIHANLSNFSAWHTRSQLILRLLAEREASDEDRRKFLESGKGVSADLVGLGSGNLWAND